MFPIIYTCRQLGIFTIKMSNIPSDTVDIIALLKNHPLNQLSRDNYNTRKEFVVELDKNWKWVGFGRKGDAKSLLVNNFIENVDYKIEKAATANAEAGFNISQEGKNFKWSLF